MAAKKRPKGGRVTTSPWAERRTVAHALVEQFLAAGWEEADADDVMAINAGELHLSKVCTCGPEQAGAVMAHAASEHVDQDHAVVVTLHDGPPVAVLVWAGSEPVERANMRA
jgi:hypothetical protein